MAKDFIYEFTDEDFNACNMIIKDKSKDNNAHYLQLHDKDKSFDEEWFIHYEIIYMLDNDKNANHKKGFVYVEIHFESERYGRYFKSVVENLVEADPSLESFPWREYCPALRLKDTKFDTFCADWHEYKGADVLSCHVFIPNYGRGRIFHPFGFERRYSRGVRRNGRSLTSTVT